MSYDYAKNLTKQEPAPIVYDGKIYKKGLPELAKEKNTSPERLRYYLNNDKPFDGSCIDYAL